MLLGLFAKGQFSNNMLLNNQWVNEKNQRAVFFAAIVLFSLVLFLQNISVYKFVSKWTIQVLSIILIFTFYTYARIFLSYIIHSEWIY